MNCLIVHDAFVKYVSRMNINSSMVDICDFLTRYQVSRTPIFTFQKVLVNK